MSRQIYIELGLYEDISEVIDVIKKLGKRATNEFIEILPKIQGFRFSMDDSCPFYEVKHQGEWCDLLFVLEKLLPD